MNYLSRMSDHPEKGGIPAWEQSAFQTHLTLGVSAGWSELAVAGVRYYDFRVTPHQRVREKYLYISGKI